MLPESLANTIGNPEATSKDHVIHVYPRAGRMGRAIRTATHWLVEWKVPGAPPESAELELYDYLNDRLETKNIAADDPATVSKLRDILSKYPEAKLQIRGKAKKPLRKPGLDREKMFAKRDANGDGKLTLEERVPNRATGW